MQYKKLARMAAVSGAALTMMVSPALTSGAGATTLQPTTSTVAKAGANGSPTVTTASVRRLSKKCTRPRGKRFTVSYRSRGNSTTFIFSNKCSHYSHIFVRYGTANASRRACIKVRPRTRGTKVFTHPGRILSVQLRHC